MQSSAKTVDDYLDEVPAERKAALSKIRSLCTALLTGFEEQMIYGGPGYVRNGVVEVGFASQKQYISLYILSTEVMQTYKARLAEKGIRFGKGCIRYPNPKKIDFELIELLLKAAKESESGICD